jgi:hypothetical protein
MTASIVQTATNDYGHTIRVQKRRGKFDVIINITGYSWRYLKKGVSEQEAHAYFTTAIVRYGTSGR